MKKRKNDARASREVKAQALMNKMVKCFALEPSQYETAKMAIDYAMEKVADLDAHEDEINDSAFDYLAGYVHAQRDLERSRHDVNFMEIVEDVMLCKGAWHAFGHLEDFAEEGDSEAALLLAEFYLRGDEGPRNIEKGVHFLELALEMGNAEAFVRFGSYGFRGGSDTEEIRAEAFAAIHKAALQGHPEAEKIMSVFYHDGYGCQPNEQLAEMWSLKAEIDNCNEEKVLSLLGCNKK